MYQTRLRTAQLGDTDLEITHVGFGAWAIVGFRRPDQVDPILAAANLELTAQDLDEIEGARR
jgi:aryl-alcohol dehydrogenase-like predicted oxidoreductase